MIRSDHIAVKVIACRLHRYRQCASRATRVCLCAVRRRRRRRCTTRLAWPSWIRRSSRCGRVWRTRSAARRPAPRWTSSATRLLFCAHRHTDRLSVAPLAALLAHLYRVYCILIARCALLRRPQGDQRAQQAADAGVGGGRAAARLGGAAAARRLGGRGPVHAAPAAAHDDHQH